jgi:vacuolar-type H+-ATPase subunit C/Vma6
MRANTAYVAARAKSRKSNLADKARLRQLVRQSPDQLTIAVGDMGYRNEIDMYAGKLTGGDLVEAALTHNLEAELLDILRMCNAKIKPIISVYTLRFEYQNAKVVLRSVLNEVEIEKVKNSILPAINEINTPWISIIEESDTLRSAAIAMKRKSFGQALSKLPENASLYAYEDALDRHYFNEALSALSGNDKATKFARKLLALEIDHKNILNILEANSVGLEGEAIANSLLPGGRLVPTRSFSTVAMGGKDALLDLLRANNQFDLAEFEEKLKQCDERRSLDPMVTWFKQREHDFMAKMSFLHPISALPIIHYIAMKVEEVNDLRIIVRGLLAGLPEEVIDEHVL